MSTINREHLAEAKLIKVLDENERLKYMALHVLMKSSLVEEPVDTVILCEKTSIASNLEVSSILGLDGGSAAASLKTIDCNDIYYRFLVEAGETPQIKLTIIHPATPKHIAKYTKQERVIVQETPAIYKKLVEPYIEAHPAARLQWIQNILEEKSEMDGLVFADRDPENGFYLLPDSKWDRRNLSGIYLLAISKNPAIRSIRDIDGSKHLALLEGIRRAVDEEVPKKYAIRGDQLRCFIHYQPTYYHFHVHVVHVNQIDGVGALVAQSILLDDAIDNLKTFGADFYQKKTLTYAIGCNHELYHQLVVKP